MIYTAMSIHFWISEYHCTNIIISSLTIMPILLLYLDINLYPIDDFTIMQPYSVLP